MFLRIVSPNTLGYTNFCTWWLIALLVVDELLPGLNGADGLRGEYCGGDKGGAVGVSRGFWGGDKGGAVGVSRAYCGGDTSPKRVTCRGLPETLLGGILFILKFVRWVVLYPAPENLVSNVFIYITQKKGVGQRAYGNGRLARANHIAPIC